MGRERSSTCPSEHRQVQDVTLEMLVFPDHPRKQQILLSKCSASSKFDMIGLFWRGFVNYFKFFFYTWNASYEAERSFYSEWFSHLKGNTFHFIFFCTTCNWCFEFAKFTICVFDVWNFVKINYVTFFFLIVHVLVMRWCVTLFWKYTDGI